MPKDHLPEVGPNLQKLPPDRLHMDGGTQPRGRLDDDVVERYAEAMVAGLWEFNKSSAPITAFSSERGQTYWLADGFHRVAAAKQAGLEWVAVDIRQGNQRDAILYSVGANATHGLPRSNDDKRHAVSRLLEDPEWSQWSDREIARRCCVAPTFVGKLRSLSTVDSEKRTYVTKHGTVATMDTTAIGGKVEATDMPAEPAVQLEVGSTAKSEPALPTLPTSERRLGLLTTLSRRPNATAECSSR